MNTESLIQRQCTPCQVGARPLSPDEAQRYREEAPTWRLSVDATRLTRRFHFENFQEVMSFVNRVADVAETEGHHPDIHIHWNRLELELYTHKIRGLHENDFILAAKLDDAFHTWLDPLGFDTIG